MMFRMPVFVDWLITILVVALVVAHIGYIVSLRRQPTGRRPRTVRYDRFGQPIEDVENPDYHVIPADNTHGDEEEDPRPPLPARHPAGR